MDSTTTMVPEDADGSNHEGNMDNIETKEAATMEVDDAVVELRACSAAGKKRKVDANLDSGFSKKLKTADIDDFPDNTEEVAHECLSVIPEEHIDTDGDHPPIEKCVDTKATESAELERGCCTEEMSADVGSSSESILKSVVSTGTTENCNKTENVTEVMCDEANSEGNNEKFKVLTTNAEQIILNDEAICKPSVIEGANPEGEALETVVAENAGETRVAETSEHGEMGNDQSSVDKGPAAECPLHDDTKSQCVDETTDMATNECTELRSDHSSVFECPVECESVEQQNDEETAGTATSELGNNLVPVCPAECAPIEDVKAENGIQAADVEMENDPISVVECVAALIEDTKSECVEEASEMANIEHTESEGDQISANESTAAKCASPEETKSENVEETSEMASIEHTKPGNDHISADESAPVELASPEETKSDNIEQVANSELRNDGTTVAESSVSEHVPVEDRESTVLEQTTEAASGECVHSGDDQSSVAQCPAALCKSLEDTEVHHVQQTENDEAFDNTMSIEPTSSAALEVISCDPSGGATPLPSCELIESTGDAGGGEEAPESESENQVSADVPEATDKDSRHDVRTAEMSSGETEEQVESSKLGQEQKEMVVAEDCVESEDLQTTEQVLCTESGQTVAEVVSSKLGDGDVFAIHAGEKTVCFTFCDGELTAEVMKEPEGEMESDLKVEGILASSGQEEVNPGNAEKMEIDVCI